MYPPIRNRSDMEQDRFDVYCPICRTTTTSTPTSENRPLSPISVYGWTKKAQEELFQLAAQAYGLPTIMLRYFNVYGSRQSLINPYTGIVSIFFNRLREGKSISVYEHGAPLRDFVHVFDVVQANLAALESELPAGTILNVGTGQALTVFDLARALAQALGATLQYQDHGEFRVGDIHACVADLAQIRSLLRYEPHISLDDGMHEFVNWALGQASSDQYQKTVSELKAFGLFGASRVIGKQ